jgi:hypothetical protein
MDLKEIRCEVVNFIHLWSLRFLRFGYEEFCLVGYNAL